LSGGFAMPFYFHIWVPFYKGSTLLKTARLRVKADENGNIFE
jgi:hypothetical protein